MQKSNILRILLGSLEAVNGLSALLGGFMLIEDPTGESLGLNLEWLQNTPFPNYLVPGIVLFFLIGLTNILGMWLSFNKKKNLAVFGTVFGLVLMGWIIGQVIWIGYQDFLQPLYFTTGLLQTFAGLALASQLKRA
ncbi:hypothetical protein [Salinimicrobium sp. TH3]|uniref:hypothetical protein n=1 Tax=Salinimicrobium sp. TH3 TaxID=2997342 RepID=UPI00227319D0|nr:hypothetical protein [Salinimicrobium sp. TH3]MCY2688571.1 hypothetical protein [Salinimicrobium sp. TH3]